MEFMEENDRIWGKKVVVDAGDSQSLQAGQIAVSYTHLDYSIIYNTLQNDPSNSEKEAVLYIYRQLRNADPADDASAREVINNLYFSEKRYDLGDVGR